MQPPKNIHHISDDSPGITRCFSEAKEPYYLYSDGKSVKNQKIIARINSMTIPPMWKNVWICADERGYLQVTGYDAKGRKQYIYHPAWVKFKQQSKFERLSTFGEVLPSIRKTIEKNLAQKGWPKSKVLALVVQLMDNHYLRIGNDYYRQHNETYGLTTLRRKHLIDDGDELRFSYKAKSGKYRNIKLKNKSLIKLILATSELPGYEVFRYLDRHGKSQKIDSKDVNEYLGQISSESITAKYFRTWGATVMALDYYEMAQGDVMQNPRAKLETAIVKRVARKLGNTIATCRAYYIHPKVLNTLVSGNVEQYTLETEEDSSQSSLSTSEEVVLKIINHTQ